MPAPPDTLPSMSFCAAENGQCECQTAVYYGYAADTSENGSIVWVDDSDSGTLCDADEKKFPQGKGILIRDM
jgi:hypothetical protein